MRWRPPYQIVSCTGENEIRQYSVPTLREYDLLGLQPPFWHNEEEFIGVPLDPEEPAVLPFRVVDDNLELSDEVLHLHGSYTGNGSIGILELPSIGSILGYRLLGGEYHLEHIPPERFV